MYLGYEKMMNENEKGTGRKKIKMYVSRSNECIRDVHKDKSADKNCRRSRKVITHYVN
jgi:hypothetical protein